MVCLKTTTKTIVQQSAKLFINLHSGLFEMVLRQAMNLNRYKNTRLHVHVNYSAVRRLCKRTVFSLLGYQPSHRLSNPLIVHSYVVFGLMEALDHERTQPMITGNDFKR